MQKLYTCKYASRLFISENSVSVVAKQPKDRTDAERQAYNSAYRQCWGHLMSKPGLEFDVEVTGRASAPGTEVVIQWSLLEKLPLLHDIASNTSSAEASADEQGVEMLLPCSVWGLVSLLVLLEGRVTVRQWFESDWPANDPSLPAQTLEVRSN